MKRSITMLLAALFCLNLMAQIKPSKGDGSVASPYKISNAQELLWFAKKASGTLKGESWQSNASAILIEDIDMKEVCGEEIGNWEPIGTQKNPFKGMFLGNGHSISNFYIRDTSHEEITNPETYTGLGLFGFIKDCKISKLNISGQISSKYGTEYMGSIAARSCKSIVDSCTSSIILQNYKDYDTGGIVGMATGDSKDSLYIGSCIFSGTITIIADNYSYLTFVGGIVGQADSSIIISNCKNEGQIKVDEGAAYLGGIVGYAQQTKIYNCQNISDLTTIDICGGIVGECGWNSKIVGCINSGKITGDHAGGIIGLSKRASMYSCKNEGDVSLRYEYSSYTTTGGFVGRADGLNMRFCYSIANIKGIYAGGLIGHSSSQNKISDSYSYGSVTALETPYSGLIGKDSEDNNNEYNNVFNYDPKRDITVDSLTFKTMDEFKSGEVCYLLNSSASTPTFFQTIGADDYPIFIGNDIVVKDDNGFHNEMLVPCQHETIVDTVAANCYHKRYFVCGICYKKIIDEKSTSGHHLTIEKVSEPTCTKEGLRSTKCNVCGLSYNDTIPAIPHDTTIIVEKAAGCTNIGYSKAQCSMCNLLHYRDTMPALGHDTVKTIVEPTCTKEGYSKAQCSVCKKSLGYCDTVPALGHDNAIIHYENTCHAASRTDTKCKACGLLTIGVAEEAPTMDHDYVNDICTVCGLPRSEKPESEGDTFLIRNARELLWFSEYVYAGNTKVNAKLTADIDLSEVCGDKMKKNWLPIGEIDNKEWAFAGNFDGQGHTVSNLFFDIKYITKDSLYYRHSECDGDDIGLFGGNSGLITNVNLKGVSITSVRYVGGVSANNNGTITYCSIDSSTIKTLDTYNGSICGYNEGSVSHCYSTANVDLSSTSESTYVGGLIGYSKSEKINNCYTAAIVDVTKKNFAYTVCANKGTDCYYTADSVGGSKEGTSIFKTKDEFASGDVCYNLNKGLDEPIWAQTLGVDSMPRFYTGKEDVLVKISKVYADCPNSKIYKIEYANYKLGDDTTSVFVYKYPEHIDEDSNHKCDICNMFDQEFLDNIENTDTLKIETVDDLIIFRELVARGYNNISAKLMADIDLSAIPSFSTPSAKDMELYKLENIYFIDSNWIPIGYPIPFTGVFDGNGHIISGIEAEGNGDNKSIASLFYKIADGAVIKDVWVRGNISEIFETAGICTYCQNSTISGCVNDINVSLSKYHYYGCAGICYEMSGNSLIENCFNYGEITGDKRATGIVASNRGGEIRNCLEYSNVLKITDSYYSKKPEYYQTRIQPFDGNPIKISNNYTAVRYAKYGGDDYIANKAKYSGYGMPFEYTRFHSLSVNGDTISGELMCTLLNAGNQNWGLAKQIELIPDWSTGIDENDGYSYSVVPAAFVRRAESGIFVYPKVSTCPMNNDFVELSKEKVDVTYVYPNHVDKDGDGVYDCCGMYHSDILEPNDKGVYEICSAEQFVDFAKAVNSGFRSMNAKLTCDIDLSDYCNEKIGNWTPIDSFAGMFDGQHHRISGLYIVSNDTSGKDVKPWDNRVANPLGLFGHNYGEIKNLGIAKNCVLKSKTWPIGAICCVNNMYILSCYNEADITTSQCIVGGIVAKNDSWEAIVKNCYNLGDIISDDYEFASGIIGSSNCGWVINCHNYGNANNAITKYIECQNDKNNYVLSETEYEHERYDYENGSFYEYGVLSSQFASGEICYALNKGQDSIVWYQTLNVDPYPVLDPTHGKVLYDEVNGIYYNYPAMEHTATEEIENKKQPASLVAFVINHQVIVVGSDSLRIIDMFGRDVTACNGSLADGVYIVVANGNVAKVVVK